ncbi:MAG: hypothetical protein E6K53_00760 [Gammaproteobacteria bacterium]|nr:MAG: hypothetical protein E6K53_00760 [Gammaproteobacteria bacterium]
MFKKKLVHLVVGAMLLGTICTAATAMDKNYKRGSVWSVTLVKVDPGKGDDYLDSLKDAFMRVNDEAIKEKVLLSYKILVGDASNSTDWNVLIMTEAANFAALDTMEAKMDAIAAKAYGSLDKAEASDKEAMTNRAKIRTIYGDKMLQEIHFVK